MEKYNNSQPAPYYLRNENKIKYDPLLQRNFVWDDYRQSRFIRTIVKDSYIPAILARDIGDGNKWIVDGRQRITTIIRFLKNEFAIVNNIEHVNGIDISGMKYSDMSEEIQEKIKTTLIPMYLFKEMTDDDIREMFSDLNGGAMPLTKIELLRSMTNIDIMDLIYKISCESFFNVATTITEKQKNRFVDQETIMQIITLYMHSERTDYTDLSLNTVKNFIMKLNEEGISDKQKEEIISIAQYLSKAFLEKENFIKKVNIPIIFVVAGKAIKNGITPEKFGGLIQKFFSGEGKKSINSYYNDACSGGSAKREQVKTRLNKMGDYFNENKDSAPDYVKPIPKESKGKGAPRTVTPPIETDPNNTIHTGYESYNAPVTAGVEGEIIGDAVH